MPQTVPIEEILARRHNAELLYHARMRLGISQRELGQQLTPSVYQVTVGRWESGIYPIRTRYRHQLAAILGFSPDDFRGDPDPRTTTNIHSREYLASTG